MTDVFISYSSKDKNVADTVCAKLEQANMKCWIAPRDIKPGEQYASGIVRGIDNAKCMVLIFSQSANNSQHVLREIERCIGNNTIVIPFKIDDVMPSDAMDYFLKVAHWLDVHSSNLEQGIEKLKVTVGSILDHPIESSPSVEDSGTIPVKANNSKFILAGVSAIVLASVVWFASMSPSKPDQEVPPQTRTESTAPIDNKLRVLEQFVQQNKGLLGELSLKNIESAQAISDNLPNHLIKVKAWSIPERSQFIEDEKVSFKVSVDSDAYLLTYVHSVDGSTYLIYPNKFASPQMVSKEDVFNLGQGTPFELVISEPFGIDLVHVIATTNKDEYLALLDKHQDINGMDISTIDRGILISEAQGIGTRGISVVKAEEVSPEERKNNAWGEAMIILNTQSK